MSELLVVGNVAFDTLCSVGALPEKNEGSLIEKRVEMHGGCAGNVAWTATQLGVNVGLISRVGPDFWDSDYEKKLRSAKIDLSSIQTADEPTAHAYLFSDRDGNQQIYYSPGACQSLSYVKIDLGNIKIVHFTAGPINDYLPFMEEAAAAGCRISFDPGQETFHRELSEITACIPHVNYLFLNHHELLHILKKSRKNLEELFDENPNLKFVCESRGPKGAFIHERGNSMQISAKQVEKVIDPTGAGDAHRAGFLAGLLRGKNLAECGNIASMVAAEVVSRCGAQATGFDHIFF